MPPKITLEELKKSKPENKRTYPMVVQDNTINDAIDPTELTVWFTAISNNNAGLRETYSGIRYIEQIDVDSVDVSEFKLFIRDHTPSTDNVIGKVIETIKEDGKLKARIKFSSTQAGRDVFSKYQEGILDSVSVGYSYSLEDATIIDDETPLVILRNVKVFELSSVWKPFDAGAVIGRDAESKTDDTVLPTTSNSEKEEGSETGIMPDVVAQRISLLRRNIKIKHKG
jgi:hypothetical protein